jgi:hypothetical protein
VRNVRAAGGEVALRHGPREEVHLQEVVAPDLRAPVLKAYLKRATNASAHMPVTKDAPLAEFERMAPRFPVFRVVPRSNSWEEGSVMAHMGIYGLRTYSVKGLDEAIEASGMTREEVERQYGAPLPTRVTTVEIGRLRHILGDTGIGGYIIRKGV